jgi:hypothetical protein
MKTRTQTVLAAAAAGLAAWAAGAHARAQFQAPPNSLSLEGEGTLDGFQGQIIKFRDAKNEAWLLVVVPQTAMTIDGQADGDYLRPGMTVELTGEFDKKYALTGPIAEISVIGGKGKPMLGLFSPDDDPQDAKPLRNPEAGKYRIRGKLASVKQGELLVVAGRTKITGTLADDAKVKLNLDDFSTAQFGDAMKIKAWYTDVDKPNATFNRPGKALAEAVTITLSQPPSTGKRPRASNRATKTVDDAK